MNDLLKILMVAAAIAYGMTAQLPANETAKKPQDALEKWYEDFSQSVSKEFTNLGVTLQQMPDNISVGVSNWWEETKKFQSESWQQSQADINRDWQTIKRWFNPTVETEQNSNESKK